MPDTIRGTVVEVIDGGTLVMQVTFADPKNIRGYSARETVLVVNCNAPEFTDPTGAVSTVSLEGKVLQREVFCRVRTRDSDGHVVAHVSVIG